jgi:hypothetical protein
MQDKNISIRKEITTATKVVAVEGYNGAITLAYSAPNGQTYLIDALHNQIGLKTFTINKAVIPLVPTDNML